MREQHEKRNREHGQTSRRHQLGWFLTPEQSLFMDQLEHPTEDHAAMEIAWRGVKLLLLIGLAGIFTMLLSQLQ
uniref:Uncharacterized protein n=1 Tax=Magnetococcus massalia (strain MO-1) TaxID=451514 RepID=A0A1S7LHN7_MAGMO|nr:Protein of unknown function [Candidatus Magnetococcus massalia]